MDTYHAASWSDPCYTSSSDEEEENLYRITHPTRTERRGKKQQRRQQQQQQQRPASQDSWTWEQILNREGPWAQAGENRRPKAELEAAKAERRGKKPQRRQQQQQQQQRPASEQSLDYTTWEEIDRWAVDPGRVPEPAWDSMEQCKEGYRRMRLAKPARQYERQPQIFFFWGGHTRCGTKPGSRPELTPRAYDKQRITGQAPCYAVKRTVSPVRAHSPVRYRAAPRECHASVGIEPGRMVPAQRFWSPVRSFGPGYPAPALRAVSPGRWEGAVRPLPALRSCWANVGVEPKGEVRVVSTRSPVLTHSPVQPVPALWRVRARVVVQPGEVVPRLCSSAPPQPSLSGSS
ncbi:uncharacterized protein LOC135560192 [Oncorhynchus nerka]|uniref:uncharacterized protein LOC135560192 n=1 Tax=Oncorhynchus nerka TaxID=8023 RepID=UPI0031B82854